MANVRSYLTLAASFSAVVIAGCSGNTPSGADVSVLAKAEQAGADTGEAKRGDRRLGSASAQTQALPVNAPIRHEPAYEATSEAMTNAARVEEMREPYANLSAAEAQYFDGKFVKTNFVSEQMRSPDFDSTVSELRRGSDAQALAREGAYTAAFEKSLKPYADRAQLTGIGCGTVLCMGSLRTTNTDWLGPWTIELHNQPLPLPSLAVEKIRRGGEYEVRFSFTTVGAGGFSSKN